MYVFLRALAGSLSPVMAAYVSIRQHTSAYGCGGGVLLSPAMAGGCAIAEENFSAIAPIFFWKDRERFVILRRTTTKTYEK